MKKILLMSIMMLSLTGCQSAYYSAMEKVGIHKRDILVDRVEATKESQEKSQKQFQSSLEHLSALINFNGGELQTVYEQLSDDYEASKSAADTVTNKINKVEDVGLALFSEWETELEQYQSASLKRESQKKLNQTQRQFNKLLRSMRRSEQKMAPVLAALKDNTLYLKHNLNAQAISAIKGEFTNLKRDIQTLIKDMNNSIDDSNKFIKQMNGI
ncbi:DUF2959 domain-containing protein [Pseudoalteromonas denitrificans]|uniref:DUF2959 domain-containing protein n=1 Tax=Pseudoalteromonas denitrificans DSM 6059 TaxID=1123010 RepID=A0A1I1RBA9_9GAMM|nr:DUF2959 domain-containing protein [Pseudoalteromonas denitrificans]SFD31545.1 Protein of unknown function [Pseudoalteromonas denitrificans DSM 6059]